MSSSLACCVLEQCGFLGQINIRVSASVAKFLFGCTLLQSTEDKSCLQVFADFEFKVDVKKTCFKTSVVLRAVVRVVVVSA